MKRGRPPYPDILTPREWEVLALVERGYSNEEIAAALGISIGGAKFHVSQILGKLHVVGREEAARWHRQRFAPAPLWMLPLDWLRALVDHPARAAGGTVVMVAAAAIAVGVWGVTRTEDTATAAPEIVRTPDYLASATWMNDGEWILAYDNDEQRYNVVDRAFREVFALPADVVSVRGSPLGTLLMEEYAFPLARAVEEEADVRVWDAATGEQLYSFRITREIQAQLLEGDARAPGWGYFAEDGRYGWRNDAGDEIAPTSLIPADCGIALSGDGRFAVVRHLAADGPIPHFCEGPCRLIDVERNQIIQEWNLEWDDGSEDTCTNVEWTQDGRTILLSKGLRS